MTDDKDISIIKEYYNTNKGVLTKKDILNKLLTERKISLSITVYNKIIKDLY